MFSQIFFTILAMKIGLVIGLTGFLSLPQKTVIFNPQDFTTMEKSAKTANRALQTLPVALKKAEYKPRPNGVAKISGKVSALSYIAMDEKSEATLASLDEKVVRPIGSISKLMAAVVFLKNNPKWNQIIEITPDDNRQGNNYVYQGEKTSVRNFFKAAMVGSSNTAVMVLVRSTGLGERQFVTEMNEEAEKMGLNNTSFAEPTGLSPQNKSTAKEVALLLKNALLVPEIQEAVASKIYEFEAENGEGKKTKRKVVSTDQLLFSDLSDGQIKSIIGGKTGFIEEAGHCFAVEVENSVHNRIIVVVLGSDSEGQRFSEAKDLADWVFKSYTWPGQEITADK